ncbi:phospholipase D family protein, partial [Neisseria sp. P0006.S005]
ASHSAYNATSIIKRGNLQKGLVELYYTDQDKNQTLIRYRQSIEHSNLYQKKQSNLMDWQSVSTRLISDYPAKGLER